MQALSNPPIGLAAVEAFYSPVANQLVEFAITCGDRSFRVTAHRKAAPNITAFFALVDAAGHSDLIKTFDGCYEDRPKRMSNQLSMHGRGAAFDIDAGTNNQGDAHGDMPQALVDIARSLGFFWGGDFRGQYVDKMHFQLGVDFALGDRPEPRVTYDPAQSEAPSPAAVNPLRTVKLFDNATGAAVGMAAESGLLYADGRAYIRATALPLILGDATLTADLEQGVIILRKGVKPPA